MSCGDENKHLFIDATDEIYNEYKKCLDRWLEEGKITQEQYDDSLEEADAMREEAMGRI